MVKISLGSSIYVPGNYWRIGVIIGSVFIKFSLGFVNLKPVRHVRLSLMRHFIPGRFTACPGTDFASFFTGEITAVEYAMALRWRCIDPS